MDSPTGKLKNNYRPVPLHMHVNKFAYYTTMQAYSQVYIGSIYLYIEKTRAVHEYMQSVSRCRLGCCPNTLIEDIDNKWRYW